MAHKLFDFTHDNNQQADLHRELLQMAVMLTQARIDGNAHSVDYMCDDMRKIHNTLLELAGLKAAKSK